MKMLDGVLSGVTRGLLWRDWQAFGGMLRWGISLWVTLIWVLLLLQHPAAIAVWAVVLTIFCVPTVMAHEVMEGSLEFSLALPPTRRERYLTRLGLLGGIVVGGLAVGLLAYGLNLPQKVWGLFTSSLMTRPFVEKPLEVMVLAFASPVAFFGMCYGGVMGSGSRLNAFGTMVLAAIATAVLTFAIPAKWLAVGVLLVVGVGALVVGYVRYEGLEAVNQPGAGGGGRVAGPLVGLGILGLLILWMMFMWVRNSDVQMERREAMEAESFELMMKEAASSSGTVPLPAGGGVDDEEGEE